MIKARYDNHTLGMHAIIRESAGKFSVTDYDSYLGFNCGMKTFSSLGHAVAWCIKNGFVTRRDI